MMKLIYQYFFRGLLTALPIGLTIYLIYIFWEWSETMSRNWVQPLVGDNLYFPGLGLLISLISVILLGYLISHRKILGLISMVEFPFANIPVVKSIYLSLKNFADYFNPAIESTNQQAVIIRPPHQSLEMVGLITQKNTAEVASGFSEDRVAVFLPMGYNIGGYTVFVPQEWVQPIEMSADEVMRHSLFAWMSSEHDTDNITAP